MKISLLINLLILSHKDRPVTFTGSCYSGLTKALQLFKLAY